jgi:hypothetical protein
MQTRVLLVQTEMKTQGKSVPGLRNRYGRVVPFVYFDAPADANGHTFAQHRLSLFLFLYLMPQGMQMAIPLHGRVAVFGCSL